MSQIIEVLKGILSDKFFFGSITFNFEGGRLVHITKKQTYKPDKMN